MMRLKIATLGLLAVALVACGGQAAGLSCSTAQARERAVDARYYAHKATDAEMRAATAATDAACK